MYLYDQQNRKNRCDQNTVKIIILWHNNSAGSFGHNHCQPIRLHSQYITELTQTDNTFFIKKYFCINRVKFQLNYKTFMRLLIILFNSILNQSTESMYLQLNYFYFIKHLPVVVCDKVNFIKYLPQGTYLWQVFDKVNIFRNMFFLCKILDFGLYTLQTGVFKCPIPTNLSTSV